MSKSGVQYITATEVYAVPEQPQQQQLNQHQNAQGVIQLEFLPAGCGVDCWSCCICLWIFPHPQPEVSRSYMIEIDGREMGKIRQGQTSSWSLSPGTHALKINVTGVGGFIRGILGTQDVYSCHIVILPNQTARYELGYTVNRCEGSRRRHVLFCRNQANT
jgi:hypothetical protein